jgi:hypothetical protein
MSPDTTQPRAGLLLAFGRGTLKTEYRVGPAPAFRLVGPELRVGGEPVAHRQGAQWEAGGRTFPGFEFEGRAVVCYVGADGRESPPQGPFARLSVYHGGLYGDGWLLALYVEETGLWHTYTLSQAWPAVIIRPAD